VINNRLYISISLIKPLGTLGGENFLKDIDLRE